MDEYELEKKIWTETDFEQMGWHDCPIYKIRLTDYLNKKKEIKEMLNYYDYWLKDTRFEN